MTLFIIGTVITGVGFYLFATWQIRVSNKRIKEYAKELLKDLD